MPFVRLFVSILTTVLAIILVMYILTDTDSESEFRTPSSQRKKGKINALFSFTSPGSLFPPSAIISLTDDNSTFFLARPAAFGPALPEKGLSGPIWIGGGFGEDAMGSSELGCGDVPGWKEESIPIAGEPDKSTGLGQDNIDVSGAKGKREADALEGSAAPRADDGTDDHLLPNARTTTGHSGNAPERADIQSLQESAEIAGKVVLLKRGGCGFLEKVKWAQRRGGVAVIVGDNIRGAALVRMYAHGDTSNVTIPAVFTSHTTAHLLSSLLPTGDAAQNLSPEDEAKLKLIKKTKRKSKDAKSGKRHQNKWQTGSGNAAFSKPPARVGEDQLQGRGAESWLANLLSKLGFGSGVRSSSKENGRRPPNSGVINWVFAEQWSQGSPGKTPSKSNAVPKPTSTSPYASDGFVIGEQDWRDPDLLPAPSSASSSTPPIETSKVKVNGERKGGSVIPSSGEYQADAETLGFTQKGQDAHDERKGWFNGWFSDEEPPSPEGEERKEPVLPEDTDVGPHGPEIHEGLWVTLSSTNMSSSPFFDTLLVLVVSPLVTLTVVYALLLLRSRIRRRRWRAPKSVVERLPVRTYHTISDTSSSVSASPAAASATTPLLQHTSSRPPSNHSRPRSRTTADIPATSSSYQPNAPTTEEEKREAGLAEWRRRYGSRQTECVICLEDYQDGVSRVMRLPCGHEFHAECMYVPNANVPPDILLTSVQHSMACHPPSHMPYMQG